MHEAKTFTEQASALPSYDEAKGKAPQAELNKAQDLQRRAEGFSQSFSSYASVATEYSNFSNGLLAETNNEGLTQFKEGLIQHLAGSIIVKEHRLRYQQEQYNRFLYSRNSTIFRNSRHETLE